MWQSRVSVVSWLLVLSAGSLMGQDSRDGFWLGAGVSAGRAISVPSAPQALGYYVRAGGAFGPHFLLGGEVSSWAWSTDTEDTSGGNATATLLFYPWSRAGLYTKVGVGLADWKHTVYYDGFDGKMRSSGWGLTIGLGYDVPIVGRAFITPAIDWLASRVDDPWNDPRSTRTLLLTVGLTIH